MQVLFHTKEAGRVFQFWHCAHRGLYCNGIGSGIDAKYGGRARGGRELAAQHLQGRGLACAVGAYEAEELALRYPEVEVVLAIPVMAVNAYKRRFDISFLRKHFIILRASIRHIIRKINYKRRYYSRVLGLKQNKRPGIAAKILEVSLRTKQHELWEIKSFGNIKNVEHFLAPKNLITK